MYYRQVEAVNAAEYCLGTEGVHENQSCLNDEKGNTEIRFNEPQQQFCHPAHHDEQQQQAAAAAATAV